MKKPTLTLFILLSVISIIKATENIYMFSSTSYTVCSANFYDGEGPTNDYLKNQNVIVTLYPSTPGAKVSVTFNSFSTQAQYDDDHFITRNDILYVYNGNSIESPQIGAMQGIGYGTVTSTAADGSLTFKFVSFTPRLTPASGVRAGWSATISCSLAPPNDITMIGGTFTTSGGKFYDAGGPNGDYMYNQNTTLTLFPATPGAKVSVTFDSFITQVLYDDDHFITHSDILYVFNGSSITSPQIGAMQGVGYGTVTSTAADGSLTFQFVSNAPRLTPASGSRAGWSATISCNSAPPNDITMIGGTFTTSGGKFYDAGGPNGDYMYNQNTTLTLYPATPGAKVSITFDSFKTQVQYADDHFISHDDILYAYNGNSITAPQIGALQGQGGYGTITSTSPDGSLTFKFVSNAPRLTPASGSRAGWSATISCSSAPPNDITMIAGTAFTTCGGKFYDSGGPNGDYMNNQNSTLTLYPATPGAKVNVTFDLFNTQVQYNDDHFITHNDILYIYNGNSIAAPQIAALQGLVGPRAYNSTASDGSLTFKFVSFAPRLSPGNGVRAGWSATIACSSTSPAGLNYPIITLTKVDINAGQDISIIGKDFKPGGTANITIFGSSGVSQNLNNINIDGQGGFSYNFATTTEMPSGIYSISATDNISGLSTPIKQFSIKSPSLQTNHLLINSPLQPISVNVNEKFLIEWQDKMVLGKSYTLSGSKRNYKYTIELSNDNGSIWKTLKTIEGQQYVDSWVKLNYSTLIASPGSKYIIRITDSYNNTNSQSTPVITVNQPAITGNLRTDLNWDFSFPQPSCSVEGVAAEGTARIFLNLSKINSSLGSNISSVKVTLSDDFNKNDPTKLGKVKVATQTTAYNSEANGITSITATDNVAKKTNYIFWYVAPDDFVGADTRDLKSSSRTVVATFTVNYTNNTIETIPQPIRIVRPPLMLVHGLASDASTWDYFRHNALGYELKFTEDFRFKTCKAVNIFPDASFKRNAKDMTILNNSNSFQGVIVDIRNKGYAANRVDYVCHSMGGCVLRSIYDNYYADFTKTGIASNSRYKNYEKGYVNKVVMIGTPNNSSPWADIVNRYSGDLPYPWVCGIIQSWYGFSGTDKPLPLMYMQPVDNNAFIWTYKVSDAVKDMQIEDAQGGVNFGVTNTRAHLIAGDFFPGAQYNTNGIIPQEIINIVKNIGDEKLQDLLNYFLKIACKKESDPKLHQQLLGILNSKVKPIEKALAFLDRMAMVMDAFNVGTFLPESDLVVSVGSQLAGYSRPASNDISNISNISVYDNFVGHAFIRAETKNIEIGNMVNCLLNRDINSNWFDKIPATPVNKQKSKSIFDRLNNDVIISKTDTNKLKIIKPINNTTAYVDSSSHVQFSIKDTTNLKSVKLMFQNRTYNVDSLIIGTIDINLQINNNLLDNQRIMLEGFYLYPDSAVFVYDQINVNILSNDKLTGFGINPKILYLFKNQIKAPEFYCTYKNSVASGNFSQNITAVVKDTTIIKFDLASKGFKGITTGETFATISYKGFSDTIYFVVDEINIDSTTVGINEPKILQKAGNYQSVKIYPNPFSTSTNIVITGTNSYANQTWSLMICDVMGKVVRRIQSSYSRFVINRDGLPTGIYFYNVKGKTGIVGTGKLMIVD